MFEISILCIKVADKSITASLLKPDETENAEPMQQMEAGTDQPTEQEEPTESSKKEQQEGQNWLQVSLLNVHS